MWIIPSEGKGRQLNFNLDVLGSPPGKDKEIVSLCHVANPLHQHSMTPAFVIACIRHFLDAFANNKPRVRIM